VPSLTLPSPLRTAVTGLPRWVVPSSLGIALAGLATSIYLTVEHFTAPGTAACPIGDPGSCATVTTSAQSKFLGIPVAVLGVVYFVGLLALCLPQVWALRDVRVWQARVAAAGLGMVFVLYLIFAEIFIIEAICWWCTIVHLLTFALFAVIVWASAVADPSPFDRR
jgi:uncharacterized membrane protein